MLGKRLALVSTGVKLGSLQPVGEQVGQSDSYFPCTGQARGGVREKEGQSKEAG